MNLKRGSLQVCLEMLEAINSGVHKPTRIMYKVNLSWNTCQSMIDFMLERGFIEHRVIGEGGPKTIRTHHQYFLTEKGVAALKAYKSIKDLCVMEE